MVQNAGRKRCGPNAGFFFLFWYDEAYSREYNTSYFAVQTRRQELADEMAALAEDQKRLILRSEMAIFNAQLAETAQQAGVIEPRDFAIA